MQHYDRADLVFPRTAWLEGAGDMYVILTAIASYLERHEISTPEYEYLFTCDIFCAGKPNADDWYIFSRVYHNAIIALAERTVIHAKVVPKANCTILELTCNHKLGTLYYPSNQLLNQFTNTVEHSQRSGKYNQTN